jgi:lipopolysaccharide transport system ATP-binding protein
VAAPNAITATALTKSYTVPGLRSAWGRSDRIRGVSEVSFCVARSGCLAVIGRNGAGKSSLLRILAGLSRPTSGLLEVAGRRGSLLDLGAGFIEEWSGRENARTTLTLLGMGPAQIRQAMEFVADFCELRDFLDRPVRIYSAGMRVRLAYSLVIACAPDIVVADEVLSVGDEAFQKKCSNHILRYLKDGGTMVLATHNLYLAERLCDAAIWLDDGRVRAQGACHDVTKAYSAYLEEEDRDDAPVAAPLPPDRRPQVWLAGHSRDREGAVVPFASELRVAVESEERARLEIRRMNGTLVFSIATQGRGIIAIDAPALLPGRYKLRLIGAGSRLLDERAIECVGQRRELGTVYLEHQWV